MVPRPQFHLLYLTLGVFSAVTSTTFAAESVVWPTDRWHEEKPSQLGLDKDLLNQARDYAMTAGGSGMVIQAGHSVLRWGDQQKRYDIKSATKSFGATALGVAIQDGKIALDDKTVERHPRFGVAPNTKPPFDPRCSTITIRQLASQTSGFAKPGGYEPLLFDPGSHWHYSDGGPNWLAEAITLAYQQDLSKWMFERVFTPIGIKRSDLTWRKNQYRPHQIDGIARREFGAGISANVDAMARLGLLYLRGGVWQDSRILTSEFVTLATRPIAGVVGLPEGDDQHGNASDHYGLLWWNNADGTLTSVPRDAFWAWGLYDSLIVVIPSLDLVVVRGGARGKSWKRRPGEIHYNVLKPFLQPIVAACNSAKHQNDEFSHAPYPPSTVITELTWAPVETIRRAAKGSDNWPLTWCVDDRMLTAYGDGRGFEPHVERKLSLGLARIVGGAQDFQGNNLRSSIEQTGDGNKGRKASGLLMIKGQLFMLARNAENSQLAWSPDNGKTWTWADWQFRTSFGCPTFLNFGRNYEGAKDDFVYIYSLDSESAYKPADRMVLARVPQKKIKSRAAYEFFAGPGKGKPTWTKHVELRKSVFDHPRRCYRSSVAYNAAIDRYLWVQIIPDLMGEKADTRFEGGFGVYDAPTPWGPWTTVYFSERWDVAPGESASFPTKWMSGDGKSMHLVFSGEDSFSVRRATLKLIDRKR